MFQKNNSLIFSPLIPQVPIRCNKNFSNYAVVHNSS